MFVKKRKKDYTISFFPSDKDGIGFVYENHTYPDAPKKAFLKILIAAGFLGIISTFVFTPPADEFSSVEGALVTEGDMSDTSFADIATVMPAKHSVQNASFASKALSALTSRQPVIPADMGKNVSMEGQEDALITMETRTVVLSATPEDTGKELQLTVRSGDNIVSMLRRNGISNLEANRAALALGEIYDLKKIRPKQEVQMVKKDGLFSVTLKDKEGNKFSAVRDENGEFMALKAEAKIEIRRSMVSGVIMNNFTESAEKTGMPSAISVQFIRALNDEVNFKTDIKKGDRFEAVFEERFNEDGEDMGGSKLLFASLVSQNQTYNRFYFKNNKGAWGYYDEEGNSTKQTINVWPVGGARITSRFGTRRHPILLYPIHHSGVDYGVSVGTPVAAAADGEIVYIGTRGGYGKYVQLKHESGYATAYAHLNSYNSKLKVGSFVKQGQVIAYTGNTGRSTGPHLHFEVIKMGQKVNPLGKDRFFVSSKLKGSVLKKFWAECEKIKPSINFAKNEPDEQKTKTR